MTLNRVNFHLLTILIFLLFALLVIQIYRDSVDDFSPKHVGAAYLLTSEEPITGYASHLIGQVPAYYAFIAMTMEVTDLDMYRVPVSPVIFLPYLVVFFACVYTLSKRSLPAFVISMLLTFVAFTLPLNGTHKIWLWAHGLGEVLIFTFILLLGTFRGSKTVANIIASLLLLGAVALFSYNAFFYLLIFVCSLLFFTVLRRGRLESSLRRSLMKTLLPPILASIVVLLVFSRLVYDTLIPLVQQMSFTLHPLHTFVARFFGQSGNDELLQLAISFPGSLTAINIVKYMIYGAIIVIGLIVARRYLRQKESIPYLLILVYFSTVVAVIAYIVARFLIGYFALPTVFFVVIFSVVTITYAPASIRRLNIQKCLIAVLALLLTLNLASLSIAHGKDIVHQDSYDYIIVASDWVYENHEGRAYFPDQLTFGWAFMKYCERLPRSAKVVPTNLPKADVLSLYHCRSIHGEKTIIINYRGSFVQVEAWNSLLSFKEFRETVEANPSIRARIYALNDYIVIVQTG